MECLLWRLPIVLFIFLWIRMLLVMTNMLLRHTFSSTIWLLVSSEEPRFCSVKICYLAIYGCEQQGFISGLSAVHFVGKWTKPYLEFHLFHPWNLKKKSLILLDQSVAKYFIQIRLLMFQNKKKIMKMLVVVIVVVVQWMWQCVMDSLMKTKPWMHIFFVVSSGNTLQPYTVRTCAAADYVKEDICLGKKKSPKFL